MMVKEIDICYLLYKHNHEQYAEIRYFSYSIEFINEGLLYSLANHFHLFKNLISVNEVSSFHLN